MQQLDRLIDILTNWLIGWLTDWLTNLLIDRPTEKHFSLFCANG